MVMQTPKEQDFEKMVREGLIELKQLGYIPTYFIEMLDTRGAAQAVRDLIDGRESEGFTRLWELRKLEHSAEAIVADMPEWAELFTDAQRLKAYDRLKRLNYTFKHPNFAATPQQSKAGTDWTDAECEVLVRDYFDMLAMQILGTPYNKAAHNRRLREAINRSEGSIERKHQNVSAVLIEMRQPYIYGYKPLDKYQAKLAVIVNNYLDAHPDFFTTQQMLAALEPEEAPSLPDTPARGLFDPEPPELILPEPQGTPWLSRRGRRINFSERDAHNRKLGTLGERFIVELEQRKLREAGRDDLAAKVEWIADTCGDGVGYDVLSFEVETDAEKWVEVKTTGLGKYHPFLVSANEVRCSEAEPERFHLYRVYEFRNSPRVYVLPGSLSSVCELQPSNYVAAPKQK